MNETCDRCGPAAPVARRASGAASLTRADVANCYGRALDARLGHLIHRHVGARPTSTVIGCTDIAGSKTRHAKKEGSGVGGQGRRDPRENDRRKISGSKLEPLLNESAKQGLATEDHPPSRRDRTDGAGRRPGAC